MSRTVVAVWKPHDGELIRFRLESSSQGGAPLLDAQLPVRITHRDIKGLATVPLKPGAVRKAGRKLFDALRALPSVAIEFDHALQAAHINETPLYIRVDQSEAEALPWETLCDATDRFLALNGVWPIARIAGTADPAKTIERTFTPPCKVLAVLSAAKVSAASEWKALYAAFKETTFERKLMVMVGEPDLFEIVHKQAEIDAWLEVSRVPSDAPGLVDAIRKFNPHLLHFFCHGESKGKPHLQVATATDWDRGADRGSVDLQPDQFQPLQSLASDICIVVLNCCKGATAVGEVHSLALSLINQGPGFPSVVGMREVIDSADAHLFCEAFYRTIVERIENCHGGGAPVTEAEWVGALQMPRAKLVDRHRNGKPATEGAADRKEWTLPIVYVRPEPFRLSGKPSMPLEQRRKLETQLNHFRRFLAWAATDPSTPPDALPDIALRIKDLEDQLGAD